MIVSTHEDNKSYSNRYPQIVVDASGNSYITWEGYDGNDEIYWVTIDATGQPGAVKKISTHKEGMTYDDRLPQIAVDASGNSYITWYGYDGNDADIYWVTIDATGTCGTIQMISNHPDNVAYNDYHPQIAVDASGNSYVVWHGCDKENCWEEPGDLEIYWVKIDTTGTPGTVKKIPPTSPDNVNTLAMRPQLAADALGNSSIVWSGVNEESYDIYWVRIDASEKVGTVKKMLNYPDMDYDDYNPQITVDASGVLYVTWENFDENDYDIYWTRINAPENEGTVQKISTYLGSTVYDDTNPQIAVDVIGNSYIAWESFNRKSAEQFDQQIYWIKIDAEGNPGKVQNLSSRQYAKHFDRKSRIAVDTSGNSYVTWEGEDTSKIDHIFFTAHLPNPTILLKIILALIAVVVMVTIGVIAIVVRKKTGRDHLKR
jgi:hypothetical protein